MAKRMKYYSLWFLLINVIVFIIQTSVPGFTELGILNSNALSMGYWRFVTAIFLHGSLAHLMYNMFALFFFGFSLERLIGSRKFLVVFFGSGILANLISVNFYSSSLGASGAIMGIIGCLAIIRPFMMVWAFGLILPMFIAAILWIVGDILGIFMPSNVGNIAHLSGAGVGILLGLILKELRAAKKQLIKMPENYMKVWERKYMK